MGFDLTIIMTRPKVDPDKRQRTAQACDSCKRRKQKCNGEKPCNTCTKRQLDCQYNTSTPDHSNSLDNLGPPTKRRNVDSSPTMVKSPIESVHGTARRSSSFMQWNQHAESGGMGLGETIVINPERKHTGTGCPILGGVDGDFDSRSKLSNASVAAEEAEVYHPQNRMLQDSTGRLLYIGDSATLSYLQWIRMIVEHISGPSDFTVDPRRHMIMENAISLPQDMRPTGILPDQRTAKILINSFFTNTAGFIEVFNRNAFMKSVDECYKDPLGVTPSLLCLLYLVFAIGLVMAAPYPGSDDAGAIDKLRSESASRAELFFRSAKSLADPVSGFEDADFWSIQALLLMSLYMLAISKRNASYAYFGMAVRSAFALGLHREESMILFQPEEQLIRKNLCRTLFILDRFLSACLGRPTAISEEDCSNSAFETPGNGTTSPGMGTDAIHLQALAATVQSCQVIGMTLKRVYSKRKISTVAGQEIAARLSTWNSELPHSLHWRRLMNKPIDSNHGIAILHINILHCHSVILLTRPFFLCLLHKAAVGFESGNSKSSRPSYEMETFAQTCVEASQHTLVLAQAVLDHKYLPQCNPFVIHCVFAAALIVLSNEFASLYHNPDARTSITSAISILRFCSQNDKQAERVSYIVESFNKAVEQRPTTKRLYLTGRKTPILSTLSQNRSFDPMCHFFRLEQHDATMTSTFNEETVLVAPAQQPIPSIPLIPSTVQQLSSDENVSMTGGMTTPAGIAQGGDTLSGCESEFDLNSLWDGWVNNSNAPAAIHHHPHPSAFGPYNISTSHIHPVGPNVMYHPSEFR
ncbi:fungal-specific transcription factor domain-containing protein [Xylaria sp. FL0064]|nr:fungal-specific transcription factor domain-containing protein [Xylaria sp. FL0064]